MTTNPDRSKGRDGALSALNVVIERLNPARDSSSTIAPAKAVFGSANVLLATIRVRSLPVSCSHEIPPHTLLGLYGR